MSTSSLPSPDDAPVAFRMRARSRNRCGRRRRPRARTRSGPASRAPTSSSADGGFEGAFKGNAGHLTRHREWDGTFAEIATDLALDGARVTAIAACGQDEEREIVEERVEGAGQRARWGEPSGVPQKARRARSA